MFHQSNRSVFVFAVLSLGVVSGCEPGNPEIDSEILGPEILDVVINDHVVGIEQGATFPSHPVLLNRSVDADTRVEVSLEGDLEFGDGTTTQQAQLTGGGAVWIPAFTQGKRGDEGAIVVALSGDPAVRIEVLGLPKGRLAEIAGDLTEGGAVSELRDGFVTLRAGEIEGAGVRNPQDGTSSEIQTRGLCICLWAGNVGKLTVDATCKGKVALWTLPEYNCAPAFTPATAGVTYDEDGFKIGTQIYKVDGSTCNRMMCSGQSVWVDSCVNSAAALLGKKAPYPVSNGTFCNEPPVGVAAKLTQ